MSLLVVVAGAVVSARHAPDWPVVLWTAACSGVLMAGGIALNQWLARHSDAHMARTSLRPLPAGQLRVWQVVLFGWIASALGVAGLGALVGTSAMVVGVANWLIYVWIYTPLKTRSVLNTPVGAMAGAMPALIGAAAVHAPMCPPAVSLFGVVFFWQFPHFMAIAWRLRKQFAAAGLRMVTVTDPSGRTAGVLAVVGAAAPVPVSLIPSIANVPGWGNFGWGYAVFAVVIALGYLVAAIRFARRRDDHTARTLLRASLLYLPAQCAALLAAKFI
jgi:protoheme IX farnesyltransferase